MATTSVNEIFGQIGAAKIFAGTVKEGIDARATKKAQSRDRKIEKLSKELNETDNPEKAGKIQAKKERLEKKRNKAKKRAEKKKNAMDFLGQLARYCDIGKNELIHWLGEVLTVVVPEMEVAVKTILLTNIKSMIACAIDPRIPDNLRKEGILINEREIDPRGLLQCSPYSKWGKHQYFGVWEQRDKNDDVLDYGVYTPAPRSMSKDKVGYGVPVYSLARAKDMNAFFWFAKNQAKFVSPTIVDETTISEIFQGKDSNDSLYDDYQFIGKEGHNYLPGNVFKESSSDSTLFLCTNATRSATGTTYTILPVSNNWTSANWYIHKDDHKKEKPIMNLEFSNKYNSSSKFPFNTFRVKILPKPFKTACGLVTDMGNAMGVVGDMVGERVEKMVTGDKNAIKTKLKDMKFPGILSMPHIARFNAKGEYSKNGKYSIDERDYYVAQMTMFEGRGSVTMVPYRFTRRGGSGALNEFYLIYNTSDNTFYLSSTGDESSEFNRLTPRECRGVITECYFGETVYEFNYDYIMSFKLFDAEVIAANIVNALMNIDIHYKSPLKNVSLTSILTDLGLFENTTANRDQIFINNEIDKMVQAMIDNETSEYKSCFYTFDNEDYNRMEDETNKRVIKGSSLDTSDSDVDAIFDILNAYDANATLGEQIIILENAFTKALSSTDGQEAQKTVVRGDSSEPRDEEENPLDIVTVSVKLLVNEIVNSILTPKVLTLIQVNKKLLHNDALDIENNYTFSEKDIFKGIEGLITPMIKEIIDMIQKELLRVIMARITEIMNAYTIELAKEYAEKWVKLLKSLLSCFKLNRSNMNGNTNDAIEAAISQVDYADIDELVGQIIPDTNECE